MSAKHASSAIHPASRSPNNNSNKISCFIDKNGSLSCYMGSDSSMAVPVLDKQDTSDFIATQREKKLAVTDWNRDGGFSFRAPDDDDCEDIPHSMYDIQGWKRKHPAQIIQDLITAVIMTIAMVAVIKRFILNVPNCQLDDEDRRNACISITTPIFIERLVTLLVLAAIAVFYCARNVSMDRYLQVSLMYSTVMLILYAARLWYKFKTEYANNPDIYY